MGGVSDSEMRRSLQIRHGLSDTFFVWTYLFPSAQGATPYRSLSAIAFNGQPGTAGSSARICVCGRDAGTARGERSPATLEGSLTDSRPHAVYPRLKAPAHPREPDLKAP